METVTKCCPTRTRKIVPENDGVTTSTEYDYNAANQLESWTENNGAGGTLRSAIIGFDERGNRDTQTVTLPGGIEKTTQYDWDFQNRLVGVTDPQGGAHAYAYDYRTRRIARSEPSGATAVSWSGGLSLAEYPVSGLQSAIVNPQSPIVEYRRGPDMGGGIGGLLHSLRDGAPKYNLGNGRGDVVAQSDQSGALTWTASYEAFGTRPVETGNNADRQRANTKEEDPTGLLWEHFRYRDLETGVWLSRDPAGFVDGPNLYAYVRQNPWSKFDPLGLDDVEIGEVYRVVNHETKEVYVGITHSDRGTDARHADKTHPARDLLDREGTVRRSEKVTVGDDFQQRAKDAGLNSDSARKNAMMAVERDTIDQAKKDYEGYTILNKEGKGSNTMSREKADAYNNALNPQRQRTGARTQVNSGGDWVSPQEARNTMGKSRGIKAPRGGGAAGLAIGLIGAAVSEGMAGDAPDPGLQEVQQAMKQYQRNPTWQNAYILGGVGGQYMGASSAVTSGLQEALSPLE